jgi:hypothetical protein
VAAAAHAAHDPGEDDSPRREIENKNRHPQLGDGVHPPLVDEERAEKGWRDNDDEFS